ncbi:MAG TPA: ABC transporter ATP-binding protein [Gaiellaceae bacterium]|nr:ABC transporter ATP-binding protein [Gaiellaceae bacterium]
MTLLQVDGLTVRIGGAEVVGDVSFALERGERLGLIGESGSGKSMTALALIGLLPEEASVEGRVVLDGDDLVAMSEGRRCDLRGDRIGMIFQEPMTALNPVMRVGNQVAEVVRRHRGGSRRSTRERALELLRRVEFADPERIARAYPHELSGGQRQRVMVAMAIACSPALVLADEPTTALDVTVQAQVLELLARLVAEEDAALVLISHDLAVVSGMCDRLLVMYGGRIVESGPTDDVLERPRHPYTVGLLATSTAMAEGGRRGRTLPTIRGSVPGLGRFPEGCVFRSRCERATDRCRTMPPLEGAGHAFACWHPVERPVTVGGAT